jgi:hypothetical protein
MNQHLKKIGLYSLKEGKYRNGEFVSGRQKEDLYSDMLMHEYFPSRILYLHIQLIVYFLSCVQVPFWSRIKLRTEMMSLSHIAWFIRTVDHVIFLCLDSRTIAKKRHVR